MAKPANASPDKPVRKASARPVCKNASGAKPQAVASAQAASGMDISEQQQVLQNLHTLYTAIEQGPISVVVADANGNILHVNRHFLKVTGYSLDEALEMNPRILLSGEAPKEIYEDLWAALDRGQAWHGEFINRRKNGELYWEEAHIAPVKDVLGNVVQYVGMKLDITQRKQMERELRNKHNLLNSVINTSTDFIFVKDVQLRTVLCNEAFAQAVGKQPEDLYGKTDIENGWPEELVKGNPEKRIKGYEQDDLSALSGKMIHNDYDPATINGELRIFDTVKHPVIGAKGEIIGILGISRDITEHRAEERLIRKLLLQSRALARRMFDIQEEERRKISCELHDELGQWLTAIQAEAQVIENTCPKKVPAILNSVGSIKHCTESMHDVIHRIVHNLRPALLDTLGLADSLRELEKQWCQPRFGISCELMLEGDLASLGDEIKITVFRVVQEAFNNIANYAQANHVAIQLKRVPDADARADVLLLSITDDGVGFDMEKKSSGTGILGMRERVIATGGEFDLSSMPGQGVRIHIKLPAYIEPDEDYEQW